MKVLLDTNVMIDFWGNRSEYLAKIFREVDPVICGVVRAELLRGAFSLNNLDDISELLDNLEMISFPETEWNNFGRMLYKFRIPTKSTQ